MYSVLWRCGGGLEAALLQMRQSCVYVCVCPCVCVFWNDRVSVSCRGSLGQGGPAIFSVAYLIFGNCPIFTEIFLYIK